MKIEKGIKIPSNYGGREAGGAYTNLFQKMEIGDSFLLDEQEGQPLAKTAANCRSHAQNWAKRHRLDHKFIVRKLPDGNYRCWRIA